ncbi:hypothetical protein IFM89_033835 [Coptis chinensis]|uniref:Pentatricopeptide repeat-containing protein n=1 Tax=Coptis chinensis TaxID=261450 RepID=A0A835HLM3_9MAGN|nr:hypothetical protein IFM89_033835 [Coptis chinensis]
MICSKIPQSVKWLNADGEDKKLYKTLSTTEAMESSSINSSAFSDDTGTFFCACIAATVVRDEMGLNIEKVGKEVLGTATKVVITKDSTLMVTDGSTQQAVNKRVAQIRNLVEVLSCVDVNYGYNAAKDCYKDLMAAGIMDPSKILLVKRMTMKVKPHCTMHQCEREGIAEFLVNHGANKKLKDNDGRAGQINKASEFIRTVPVKPGPCVWGSLLGASAVHENSDMQELAYKSLIQLEPQNPSYYVSLSNIYASVKRWDVVADLRKKMKGRGLRKLPGCSWITISNETHSFRVADKTHPCSPVIYQMLDDIVTMNGSTNVPDFDGLL